jgi:hypothetical protein
LAGLSVAVWLIFIAATLACGAFIGFGKAPMLACRFGTMALVVISGGNGVADARGLVCLAFATTVCWRGSSITFDRRPLPGLRAVPVVTQIVVRWPDARTSYVRIAERVVGTVVSVVAA